MSEPASTPKPSTKVDSASQILDDQLAGAKRAMQSERTNPRSPYPTYGSVNYDPTFNKRWTGGYEQNADWNANIEKAKGLMER